MTVSERIPFSGLLLPRQEGYTYVFASFNSIMVGVLMVAIAVYVCVGLPNMNPGQLVLADMFSSGTKLTTLGAGIVVLVFVMLFAIVITSTGATFGVLMTLFSFANCLGDIVLCIAYLKRQGRDLMAELKAPYTPFEEREAECAAMDAGK